MRAAAFFALALLGLMLLRRRREPTEPEWERRSREFWQRFDRLNATGAVMPDAVVWDWRDLERVDSV